MFLLSKIITAFIMPPGMILAVMILLLFFIKKAGKAFILLFLATLVLALLSNRFISEALISPLETYALEKEGESLRESVLADAELIVVLGGGSVLQKDAKGQINNKLSAVTANRLLEGLLLQKETALPLLFTGGNVLKGKEAPGEAEGVKTILMRYGLSEDQYVLEPESRNTFENAYYSSQITAYRDIILVSSAYHLKRGTKCFESQGFRIIAWKAVDFKKDDKIITFLDFLPSMEALENSYTALHEYFGLLYYSLYYY